MLRLTRCQISSREEKSFKILLCQEYVSHFVKIRILIVGKICFFLGGRKDYLIVYYYSDTCLITTNLQHSNTATIN